MIRRAVFALALAAGALGAQSPATIRVDDAGPGPGPRALQEALARPYQVVAPAPSRYVFARGTVRDSTIIVLGRDAIVEGTLRSDLIVIGGDLYMHPGGHVSGRAITYGGGIYESALAGVEGGITAYRDFTYDIEATPGAYVLRYRLLNPTTTRTFALAGLYGVNVPSYDRTNGVSLPLGVTFTPTERWSVAPTITYRSQLGRLDPGVDAAFMPNRVTTLRAVTEYSTFSNDRWIRSDLINSVHYLVLGNDTRNYYRGRRAAITVERAFESATTTFTPYGGLRLEEARSVRPLGLATGGPWAFRGRRDADDVLRPNPLVDAATVRSLLLGSRLTWNSQGVAAHVGADLELGHWTPPASASVVFGSEQFAQLTLDGTIGFATFGTQRLDVDVHAVHTGGQAPRQRYAYLGGPGTLPTLDLLELGGDELFFSLARYSIPLDRVQLPFIGAPTLSVREILGGAGTGGFPAIHQAVGLRLAAGFVYGEVLVDPVHRRTRFGAGLSAGR